MNNASVYVGTYNKYNNGSIKGAWVDLTKFSDHDSFIDHCKQLHNDETDPEFMYQDFENFPKEFYSESSIDPDLWDFLNLDDGDKELLNAYHEAGFEGDIEDARDAFAGQFDDDYSFAWDMLENSGDLSLIPDHLQAYFDVEKFARDLMFDYSEANGYYFTNY
jgi:antirestriction protein